MRSVPTPLLVVLSIWLTSVLGLALNTASATSRPYPGLLGLLQRYPWQAAVLLTLLAGLVGWWQWQRDRSAITISAGNDPQPATLRSYSDALTAAAQARACRELLGQVRRIWIDGVLDRSLAQFTRIEFGLLEQPDVVDHPWGALVHRPGKSAQALPPGTRISHVAGRLDQHLLVLGAPGAGKTTLLLEYARDLLDQAEQDMHAPVPVVFHLSAWPAEQPPLAMWLAEELRLRYGMTKRLAALLVDQDRLAVLLDGLDEVPVKRRAGCVQAINTFRGEHGRVPLAVCARTREYHDLAVEVRLLVDGAVEVQPLDRVQVRRWLEAAGRPLGGLRSALRDRGHWLWELLDSPLLLSVAALAYANQPARAIREHGSAGQLLDTYVEAMLARPRGTLAPGHEQPSYAREDTVRWLAWLAERMGAESVFYPDQMQPDWLPTRRERWLVSTGLGLALTLLGGFAGSLVVRIDRPLSARLPPALVGAFLTAGIVGFAERHARIEYWRPLWSGASALRRGVSGALVGGLAGLLLAVWVPGGGLFVPAEVRGPGDELLVGLMFALLGGLGGTLSGGIAAVRPSLQPAQPYERMRTTGRRVRNVALAGAPCSVLVGLLVGLLVGAMAGIPLGEAARSGLSVGLRTIPFGVVLIVLVAGGAVYLRHRLIEAMLHRDGLIPADLVGFLDYADDRVLLRRAGGGYLFIHRLLQDHLANLTRPYG